MLYSVLAHIFKTLDRFISRAIAERKEDLFESLLILRNWLSKTLATPASYLTSAEAAHAMKNDKAQRNNAKLLAKAFGCSYAIEYHPECFSDNE